MVNPDKIFGRLGNKLFQYAYLYGQVRRGEIPDFYVQDPKYFEEYETEIRKLFGEGIGDPIDMVAIHVRRAGNPINPDEPKYSDNDFYVNLYKTPYYEDAIELFPNSDFLVFSDDIEWCKRQLIFKDFEFSEGHSEIEDLNLMASCTGHIIANSSFSWWGAFLSSYTQKVVAPDKNKWYSDSIERTICPKHWIRI